MKFKTKYLLQDYYEANKLYFFSSNWKYPCFLIGAFFTVLAVINLVTSQPLILSIYACFIGPLFLSWPYTGLRFWTWNAYRKAANLHHEFEWDINENNLVQRSNVSESMLKWESIVKTKSNERILLLYVSDRMFLMIPKRALGHEQWAEVNNIVTSKIPSIVKV